MELVWLFIAVCAFSGQVWAFRCCQELRKLRDEVAALRRSDGGLSR